jgi:CHRD domain
MTLRVLRIMVAAPVLGLGLAVTPLLASAAPVPYHAAMAASEEVSPGPSGGAGTAKITIDGINLCYDLTWNAATGTPFVAHIHQGPKGTSGPIVVSLSPTRAHTCTTVAPLVASGIAGNPGNYYVNLHTQDYPDGAIRGQLAAG